jgi:hypothetical protein
VVNVVARRIGTHLIVDFTGDPGFAEGSFGHLAVSGLPETSIGHDQNF